MKLRTSFFDITVLRKDITRFAPVWGLYLIGGILIGPGSMTDYHLEYGYGAVELGQSIGPMAFVNFLYAIVAAQLLFGDLFNSRLCNALHALPLRREGWFITHSVAGLLFSVIPNFLLSLCFLPYMGKVWYISFIWLLGMTLEYLFFFGLAAFSAMCTGNRFAMASVYTLVNFISMVIYWFVFTFYEPSLYGLHIRDNGFILFCPAMQLSAFSDLVIFDRIRQQAHPPSYISYYSSYEYSGLSSDWWYLAVLAVLGVALLGAGLLLYRRRKLECAGDFAAFRWLKPIFSVIFTLSIGAIFEMIGESFMGLDHVFLIVGIVVGYFVTQMLLQRTVRVFRWKAFGTCAIIGGVLLLSIWLTALDPLGVTRWTPDPDKVEAVLLSEHYYYDPIYDDLKTVTNPELIHELVSVHQMILEEEHLRSDNQYVSSVTFIYKMSDGRQVERRYFYATNGNAGKRMQLIGGSPEFVMDYTDWEEYLPTIAQILTDSANSDAKWYSGYDALELAAAIRADCEAGTMTQNREHDYPYIKVSFSYRDGTSHSLFVYANCKNTIAWINAHP